MTKLLLCAFLCTVLAAAAPAQSASAGKTAVLQVQNGILNTREGHQAFSDLESKFSARKADLEKRQNDIAALQDQLRKGAATMSEEAQRKVARDIERKTKALDYEAEMARADYEQEQADMMQALARKFHGVVDKYARDKELGIVVDVSNPQTPAFWWANAVDITNDVVRAYDAEYPAASAPGPPAGKKQD
jgi:outer membrane protein